MARVYGFLCIMLSANTVANVLSQMASKERERERVATAFVNSHIVYGYINVPPARLLKARFPSGAEPDLGNEIAPRAVQDEPTLQWDADPNEFYTVALVGDVTSRNLVPVDPTVAGKVKHWLVGNVPGTDVAAGEVLATYFPPSPPIAANKYRYVLLVYKQPSKLNFNETIRNNENFLPTRLGFFVSVFAKKYNLSEPYAGNFFIAQYDNSVPIVPLVRES